MAMRVSRPVIVNTGLAAALVFAGIGAFENIGEPDKANSEPATGEVTLGSVTSSVAATGNLDAPRTVGLPFADTPGLVTDVWAEIGRAVRTGDKLAAVDRRPAEVAFAEAKAAVARAKARLVIARASQTRFEEELDRASLAAAIAAVSRVRADLTQAYQTRDLNRVTQAALVRAAAREARVARGNRTDARSQSVQHAAQRRSTTVAGTTTLTEEDARARSSQASSSVTRSQSAIAAAERALIEAHRLRDTTLLVNRQEIEDRKHLVTEASRRLTIVRAGVRVNAQGARPGVLDAARADLAEARAKLKAARYALDNTVLRAPFPGMVLAVAGGVGETARSAPPGSVAASALPAGPGGAQNRRPNTSAGFVTLADLSKRTVTVKVSEADVDRVTAGQPAEVEFPATGARVRGSVASVDAQETVIGNVIQYNVRIALPSDTAARLGQTASVRIITEARNDVLQVPIEALIPAAGATIVTVLRDDQEVKVPVTVGLSGDDTVEVSSPLLKAGDVVLLPEPGR